MAEIPKGNRRTKKTFPSCRLVLFVWFSFWVLRQNCGLGFGAKLSLGLAAASVGKRLRPMRWHWGRLTRETKGECPGEWRKSLKEIGGPKKHSHLADSFSSSGFPSLPSKLWGKGRSSAEILCGRAMAAVISAVVLTGEARPPRTAAVVSAVVLAVTPKGFGRLPRDS